MHCPDCSRTMIILEYEGVELDFCPQCNGCWLDEGELEQILGGREEVLSGVDWSGGRKGKRRCPRCLRKMRVTAWPKDGPEIDVCPAACGLWFDQGELREVIRARLPGDMAQPVVNVLTEMFGALESPKKE